MWIPGDGDEGRYVGNSLAAAARSWRRHHQRPGVERARERVAEHCECGAVLPRVNTSCLGLAVLSGEYPWHQHPHSDELF